MKAVMISINPKWCELIVNGQKTIEVRKTRPNIKTPFKGYIYMTQGTYKNLGTYCDWIYENRMKVIGEFVCDKIDEFEVSEAIFICDPNDIYDVIPPSFDYSKTCLTLEELYSYGNEKPLYGLHISDLKIYDKPKELSEFSKPCDWNYDCCTCKRAKYELTKAEAKLFYGCDMELTRPPQSWCYVEDLGE